MALVRQKLPTDTNAVHRVLANDEKRLIFVRIVVRRRAARRRGVGHRFSESTMKLVRLSPLAILVLLATAVSCSDSTGPRKVGPPARLDLIAGEGQEGVVGTELSTPLAVRVTDAHGTPVSGQLVNFVITSGGGSVFAPAAVTDANGEVRNRWTLGTSTSVPQTLEARAVDNTTGEKLVFATFHATAKPGAPHDVLISAGDAQTGVVGEVLANDFAAKVADQYGNGVPGVSVSWAVGFGDGSILPGPAKTNASGIATARLTLGNTMGANSASATVPGFQSAIFHATALAGPPALLVAVSGGDQSAPVATTLPTPFVVRVTDAHGNPTSGVAVAFTVTAGGGTVSAATGVTDAAGLASTRLTLGTVAGVNSVTVSAPGLTSVSFSATGTAGAASQIVKGSGDAQSGAVGNALVQPLIARVTDAYGNGVAGVAVAFSTSTGSIAPASVLVSGGITFASLTAGGNSTCGVATTGAG
jgi:hypothetical protein